MEQPYAELSTPRAPDEADPEDPGAFVALGGDETDMSGPAAASTQGPFAVQAPGPPAAVAAVQAMAGKSVAAISGMTSKVFASHGGLASEETDQSYEQLADDPDSRPDTSQQPSLVAAVAAAAAAAVPEMSANAAHGDQYERLETPRPVALEVHSSEDPGFVALAGADSSGAVDNLPLARAMPSQGDAMHTEIAQLCPGGDARVLQSLESSRAFWLGRIFVVPLWQRTRIYIGPHWPCSLIMLGLIEGVGFFYLSKVAPSLGGAHEVMAVLVTLGSTVAFLKCALSNPGILLPGSESETGAASGPRPTCSVCHVVQPKGSRHCQFCQVCVAGYDHHCPWMSKCIGANNLMRFYGFLCVGVGSLVYMVIAVVASPIDPP